MTASLDTLPLARRITEQAYRAGASLVTTLTPMTRSTLMRYEHAADESFDHAAKWLYDGMAAAFKSGAARLAIAGGNPALLSKQDPDKVGRANSAVSQGIPSGARTDYAARRSTGTLSPAATPAWAATVFPGDAPDVALAKLWDAIFKASRIDAADPVSAWKQHDADAASPRGSLE